MKIGIDAGLIDINTKFGVEIYQDCLIKELAKIDKRNEYFLFFRSLRRKAKDLPGPNQPNFKKIPFRIPNGINNDFINQIWCEFIVPRFIKKAKIDIYHALCTSFSRKRYPCKVVVTIHDLTNKYVERGKKPKLKYADDGFERSILKADGIITVSENSKNDILKHYPVSENSIHVTYAGVKSSIFPIAREQIEKLRLEKNIPDKYILYIGYFLPHKNIERLIKAFYLFKKKYNSDYSLVLIGGKGFLRPHIKDLIAKLELESEISLIDYLTDTELNIYMNAAKLFLFPSLYEGFGLPVLESMTVGTPVICSNTSSLPEISGGAALLVDPLDEKEIAEAIWRLISNTELRRDLIKNGFDRVKKFSWENTAHDTLKAYQTIVEN